jgi:hypothetical protein
MVTHTRSRRAGRRHSGIGIVRAVGCAIGLVALAGGVALADGPDDGDVLVLSTKHIGMTSEEIAASKRAEEPAFGRADAPVESEWRSDHSEPGAEACPPAPVSASGAVASYEHCVESSIRAGNGYGESSRVCRALFPEQTASAPPDAEAAAEGGAAQ